MWNKIVKPVSFNGTFNLLPYDLLLNYNRRNYFAINNAKREQY